MRLNGFVPKNKNHAANMKVLSADDKPIVENTLEEIELDGVVGAVIIWISEGDVAGYGC